MNTDLELSLTAQNPTVQIYESTLFTLTVHNNSTVTATGVQINLPIIAGQAVQVGGSQIQLSSGSYNVYSDQIWYLPSVGAGQSETLNIEVFFLSEPSLYAQVLALDQNDSDSTPGNGTCCTAFEDDEAAFPDDDPQPLLPNLQLANLQIFGSGTPGSVINYQIDIVNSGQATAAGDYIIAAFISTDAQLSGDDIQVGTINTGNTPIGTLPEVPGAITIPNFLLPGNYQLILAADYDNVIVESSETDNTIASPVTIEEEGCNCPDVYVPVCGVDGNTYPNACEAECAGVFDYTAGECGNDNGSCSFFVAHDVLNGSDPSFNNTAITISEDPSAFHIQYGTNTNLQVNINQQGDLLNSNITVDNTPEITYNPTYIEASNEIELVAMQGANTLWTQTIPVIVDNPLGVVISTFTFTTSQAIVFGGFIVEDGTPSVSFSAFIVQTDFNGENARFTLIPDLGDTFSVSEVKEGFDGDIYIRWFTSGNISLSKVTASGTVEWATQVGADTPSITWDELEVGPTGQYVYAVLTDNLQGLVKKIDDSNGQINNTINLGSTLSPSGNFTINLTNRIFPFTDGSFLASSYYRENLPLGMEEGLEFGLISAQGTQIWSNKIVDEVSRFSPEAATADGGFLFVSKDASPNEPVKILKVTETGSLSPACDDDQPPVEDGMDLEVSLSSDVSSYSIYTNVIVTTTITNTGTETANDVSLSVPQPAGTVTSGFNTSQGFFNLFFTIWEVGSLAPGESATFDWNLFMLNNSSFTTFAQVATATPTDVDSTPGNGTCCIANEDDEAVLTLNANFHGGSQNAFLTEGSEELGRVFPNPAEDLLNLRYFAEQDRFMIQVLNVQGQILLSQQLQKGEIIYPVDIAELTAGIYFIDILDGNKRQQLRFVKQ